MGKLFSESELADSLILFLDTVVSSLEDQREFCDPEDYDALCLALSAGLSYYAIKQMDGNDNEALKELTQITKSLLDG